MQLSYQMTSRDGAVLSVWDERTVGTTISRYVGPFATIGEARTYGDMFVEGYGMVYFPRAETVEIDGQIYVRTSRSTSCD